MSQTPDFEDLATCIAPLDCWRRKRCAVEVNRLERGEDLGRERATSCFLSLMTWATSLDRLK